MVVTQVVSASQAARIEQMVTAGQRMAGAEESAEDVAAGRRVLAGEITADEAIAERFVQIDAKYNTSR